MCYLAPCATPGIWQPVLNLRARADGPVTLLRFTSIRVCDDHKATSTVDSFLSDEGFHKLAHHMRDAGKTVPRQRLTTLSWELNPIEDAPSDSKKTTPETTASP
jgi:hypothetical protein